MNQPARGSVRVGCIDEVSELLARADPPEHVCGTAFLISKQLDDLFCPRSLKVQQTMHNVALYSQPASRSASQSTSALLRKFQAEDGHENPPAYQHYLDQLFAGIDLQGKRVLEIGSGRGLISLYCALSGAEKVVSMEPELDGSTSGVIKTQQRRIEELALTNVELRRADFHDAVFADERFDVIVMIAVLNHLYETPLNAAHDRSVFEKYVSIAARLYELLDPGGAVVATDACRYCFWTQSRRLGFPKNWCLTQRTIEWQIHQQPSVWQRIFRAAGFADCSVSYPVPYWFRNMQWLIDGPMANFVLFGEFILHAQKA